MSLVFAAITPHSPALIPNIGKERLNDIEKTKTALEELESEFYVSKPETVIVISPHAALFEDAFTVNAHTDFRSSFEDFGDVSTKNEWKGAPELAALISRACAEEKIPTRLVSQENIDYGCSVPLFYLTKHMPNIKVLPIGYSAMSPKEHIDFGYLLKDIIAKQGQRVAVIASGDLSHALKEKSPVKFTPKGSEFDKQIIELLQTRNTLGIFKMEEELVKEAAECGYRSFLILLGILKNMDYHFKNLSYEHPFGVGYLVGNFRF